MNAHTMWEAWGKTNALYTAWCSSRGENPYRLFVLYAICAHAPTTQKKISDETGLSKLTVNTVMRALREEDLVSLCPGADRREKIVRFTRKGEEYAAKVLGPLERLESRVFEGMGAERMKQMADAIALFNFLFERELEEARENKG